MLDQNAEITSEFMAFFQNKLQLMLFQNKKMQFEMAKQIKSYVYANEHCVCTEIALILLML